MRPGAGIIWRYGQSLAAVAVAWAAHRGLTLLVGPGLPPYLTFYPAVMVAALVGGIGPGVVATVAAALVVAYWILPPAGTFALTLAADAVSVCVFAFIGLMISIVGGRYWQSRARLEELVSSRTATLTTTNARLNEEIAERRKAEESLRQLNVDLESRVAAQTSEIRAINEGLEQRVVARTAELEAANQSLDASRVAAMNVLQDVIAARQKAEEAERALRESEQRVRRKLDAVLSPEGDLGVLELGDLIDVQALQKLVDDFYAVAHIPMSIVDLKGRQLVGIGWQEICTKFHRVHPEACQYCFESDTELPAGLEHGQFRLYRCKNNMWDMATPIFVAGQRVGNLFSGQFFFDDETVDRETFVAQARQYGFNESLYLAALDQVPRLSRDAVEHGMAFFLQLADTLSRMGHSNVKLARLLAERDRLTSSLRESEERLRTTGDQIPGGAIYREVLRPDGNVAVAYISAGIEKLFGISAESILRDATVLWNLVVEEDRPLLAEAERRSARDLTPIDVAFRQRTATGEVKWVQCRSMPRRDDAGAIVWDGVVVDVTERKRAEESLQASMQRFYFALSGMYGAVVLTTDQGRVEFVNQSFCDLFELGVAPERLIGLPPNDVLQTIKSHHKHPDEAVARIIEIVQRGEPIRGEEVVLAGGRTCLRDFIPIQFEGKSHGRLWYLLDISQRKQAEEALRDSERRLALALEATHLGTWDFDPRMRVLKWDARCKELFGLPQDAPVDWGAFIAGLHPEDRQRSERLANDALRPENGGDYSDEYRTVGLRDGGVVRWVRATGRAFFDEAGEPIRFVGTIEDVTERRRAEEAVRESGQRFRTMADAIPQLAWVAKPDGWIYWYNRRWYEYTGTTAEQVEGWGWKIVLEPETLLPVLERWNASLRIGQPFDMTFPLRGADGILRPFLTRIIPLKNERGEVVQWFGTATDISEQKAIEEELARAKAAAEGAKAAAEEANRAKDHFLATLSHELRTPLTPVVMGLSLLDQHATLDARSRDTLEMIRRNVNMEARLIDDLLDVTGIAKGKIELSRSPVDLCAVINSAAEVCRSDIVSRRLYFNVDTGPDLHYWVEADPARLQQVFWNLLKNAIKFTPQEGYISVRCQPHEGHVAVEIKDNGIGIEPEALGRVFNVFEQGERSITRQFGGLGLGLAISKALVEMHGGQIEAESDGLGKGSTFRVWLPLVSPVGPPTGLPTGPTPSARIRPMRILLVEDHAVTAQMLQMVLTDEGHQVETAADVATALDAASRHPFDLLISDLGLPDGSGCDLLRRLRERGDSLPAIALSGYGQENDVRRSREAGFTTHLIKPASREAIAAAIAEVAGQRPEATSREDRLPPPPPDRRTFDPPTAMRHCLGKPQLLAQMVRFFLDDVDNALPQIESALQRRDIPELERLVHRLKGTVSHLAADRATQAAERAQRLCHIEPDSDEIESAVHTLEQECRTLASAVVRYQAAKAPA
ncbi:MAG: PAS domain S-box protein [Thermoguttaceae bacterium]